jgi:hypothetical protein
MEPMRLRCVSTSAKPRTPGKGLFFTEQTQFPLKVDVEYAVLGIVLFNDALAVLVMGEDRSPQWVPMQLFEMVDTKLPNDWEFASRELGSASGHLAPGVQAIWGYPELVRSDRHYKDLINHEPAALRIFSDVASAS